MTHNPKTPPSPKPDTHEDGPIAAVEAVVRRDVGYARELFGFLGAIFGALLDLLPKRKPRQPPLEKLADKTTELSERVAPFPSND